MREQEQERDRGGHAHGGEGAHAGAGDHTGAGDHGGEGDTGRAVAPPDEDTFTLPAAWHPHLRPRRGGVSRHTHTPHEAALDHWDRRLAAAKGEGWSGPGDPRPGVDPGLAAAARRHLEGEADPLGAAILATVTDRGKFVYDEVVDAWQLRHGQVFAARATVELFALDHEDDRGVTTTLGVLPEGDAGGRLWLRRGAADRLRALLVMADAEAYRAVVSALGAHRDGARRRIVVSYLVPDETDWVAQCCADPGESGREDRDVRAMLYESLHDAEQLRALLRAGGVSAYDGRLSTAATVAEGVGPAVAALIAQIWRHREPSYGASAEEQARVLARLPTDEAFALLMAHADDKLVRPALLEAADRYPLRAARLLAARAAPAPGRNSFLLAQVLTAHVATHAELLRTRLAGFGAQAAEMVRELLDPAVPDAPAEALPGLLVTPPWSGGRRAPAQRVVKGLVADEETRLLWRPAEREAWAHAVDEPERRARCRQDTPYPEVQRVRERFADLDDYRLAALFADGPQTYRPLLALWTPAHMWDLVTELKPVAARWEEAALPPLLHAAVRQPAVAGGLLLPYRQVEVARLMADWFVRLKSLAATARAWFARHGVDAAGLLVPDAAGPPGAARHNAEHALRAVAATHGEDAVLGAAAGHGGQALAVVRDLLSADRLMLALPARMPEHPAWADPRLLPRVLLRDGASALPSGAVRHVLTMLAVSRPGALYTGLAKVKETCDPESLAAFAWALFEQWRLAGMPAKESWTLHALGWLGDDGTVRRLTPVLMSWPGEGAHQRAVEALEVLAALGSDVALTQLHRVSRRARFKALRTRAAEKIEQVAADLGLSGEELADRLVPDFGLDTDGATVVDYGPRRFTAHFDEPARPYVVDQDGKRRKDLPKPGGRDDAELAAAERKRFAALKRDVRTSVSDQTRRLEDAMVAGRSWTAGEFRELFVAHPLLGHLVRGLVWLCVPAGAPAAAPARATPAAGRAGAPPAFRVTRARTFTDVRDEKFTVPQDASVRLAHPLHLGEDLPRWQKLFAVHGVTQPLSQLDRAVHRLTDAEAACGRLERFEGITVATTALLGLERRGWQRDEPMFGGVQCWLTKRVAEDRWMVLSPSEGFTIGAVDTSGEQTLEFAGLSEQPSAWTGPGDPADLAFAELDPVTVSELLADLTRLVAP